MSHGSSVVVSHFLKTLRIKLARLLLSVKTRTAQCGPALGSSKPRAAFVATG